MLLFLDFVLVLLAIAVVTGIVTQIAIPMYQGTPLFPLFRNSEISEKIAQVHEELETVSELETLDELQEELNRRKAQLKGDEQ